MGYSKKLYNVLGGYKSIIADSPQMVNTNLAQSLQNHSIVFVNFQQIELRIPLWRSFLFPKEALHIVPAHPYAPE